MFFSPLPGSSLLFSVSSVVENGVGSYLRKSAQICGEKVLVFKKSGAAFGDAQV